MRYLFITSEITCKWCLQPLVQILEDNKQVVIVQLCKLCDRWPPGLLGEVEK